MRNIRFAQYKKFPITLKGVTDIKCYSFKFIICVTMPCNMFNIRKKHRNSVFNL